MATDPIAGALRARRAQGTRFACALTLGIVLLRFIPGTADLPVFSLIENFAYDFYFEHRPARDMSGYIIIGIDEESLRPEHLGRFPWRRSVYTQLLPMLSQAKVVGIDLLFAEPSADDAALAAAIRQHGRVVLAAHVRPGEASEPAWQGYGRHEARRLPMASLKQEFVPPVPVLADAAAAVGYVDLVPDPDGVYRRVRPLQVGRGGYLYPHFSLEIARLATGVPASEIISGAANGTLALNQRRIPTRHGEMLINYAGGPRTVTYMPFSRVLAGKCGGAEAFRDRIVLIGPTAAGLYDIRPAPFRRDNRIFYGVETNANIARTLLDGEILRDFTGSVPWGLYALLVGICTSWAIWHSREVLAAVLGVGLVAVLALPAFFIAIAALHQVVPYGGIVLASVVPMALALYERLGVEKRQVTHQFGTYVSPDVLRELGEHPELVRQGQRREVTLLFSDVRGSTTIAESLPPDVWIAQLNEYLSEMSEAIFAYDGYLDKFMGDGIMAFWNGFGNQPDHPQLAMKAAVQMLRRLEQLNEQWAQTPDRVPLRIGIGLHTGEAIIGNVGSDRRTQYTAIGDTVNSASRIESLTKEFQAQIILSETTAAALGDAVPLVELGEAELRGREQPLRLFKPEGYEGEVRGRVKQGDK